MIDPIESLPDYEEPTADCDDFTPSHIQQEEGYAQLRAAIHRRVREYFTVVGVADDLIPIYADALAEDVERGLRKFADGQLEHGGDIRDKDMIEELRQEITDAGVYLRVLLLQRNYIKLDV